MSEELEVEREAKSLAAHFADDAHWWDADYVGTTDYEDRMEHYAAIAVRTLCPVPAPKADGLVEELERLAQGKHWHHTADHFQSEIEPGRWYVSDGHTGRFATEIGATGERDAELVALLLRNLPAILAALKDRDVVLEEAAKVAWEDIGTAPKDGSRVILAKHGWTTDMGDLKQGSEEWKTRFFDDRAPKKHRCWWVARGYWKADRQKWTDGLDYLTNPTHWMPDFALPPVCEVPPDGWACTRKPGHDGPCAAIPARIKERV